MSVNPRGTQKTIDTMANLMKQTRCDRAIIAAKKKGRVYGLFLLTPMAYKEPWIILITVAVRITLLLSIFCVAAVVPWKEDLMINQFGVMFIDLMVVFSLVW